MKKILPVFLLIAAILIAGYLYKKYRIAPDLKFQTLALTDLTGTPVQLSNYQGKKLFLNFFQTWCGPCMQELPTLDDAAGNLAPDNFIFICISDEPLPLLNRLQARLNPQHVIILHSVKKLKEINIFTYPTSYMLNNKGQVVFEKIGDQDWSQPEVIQLLKQKAN